MKEHDILNHIADGIRQTESQRLVRVDQYSIYYHPNQNSEMN